MIVTSINAQDHVAQSRGIEEDRLGLTTRNSNPQCFLSFPQTIPVSPITLDISTR